MAHQVIVMMMSQRISCEAVEKYNAGSSTWNFVSGSSPTELASSFTSDSDVTTALVV